MGAAPGPQPTTVAKQFADFYYQVAARCPERLPDFYGHQSDLDHGPNLIASGTPAIAAIVHRLPLARSTPTVHSVIGQPSHHGMVLVVVSGQFVPASPSSSTSTTTTTTSTTTSATSTTTPTTTSATTTTPTTKTTTNDINIKIADPSNVSSNPVPFIHTFVLAKQSDSHNEHFFCRNDVFVTVPQTPSTSNPVQKPLPASDPAPAVAAPAVVDPSPVDAATLTAPTGVTSTTPHHSLPDPVLVVASPPSTTDLPEPAAAAVAPTTAVLVDSTPTTSAAPSQIPTKSSTVSTPASRPDAVVNGSHDVDAPTASTAPATSAATSGATDSSVPATQSGIARDQPTTSVHPDSSNVAKAPTKSARDSDALTADDVERTNSATNYSNKNITPRDDRETAPEKVTTKSPVRSGPPVKKTWASIVSMKDVAAAHASATANAATTTSTVAGTTPSSAPNGNTNPVAVGSAAKPTPPQAMLASTSASTQESASATPPSQLKTGLSSPVDESTKENMSGGGPNIVSAEHATKTRGTSYNGAGVGTSPGSSTPVHNNAATASPAQSHQGPPTSHQAQQGQGSGRPTSQPHGGSGGGGGARSGPRTFGPSAVVQLASINRQNASVADTRALQASLRDEFAQYGHKLRGVEVKAAKGIAFIEYETMEGVRAAVEMWSRGPRSDGVFAGQHLHVSEKRNLYSYHNGRRPGSMRGGRSGAGGGGGGGGGNGANGARGARRTRMTAAAPMS